MPHSWPLLLPATARPLVRQGVAPAVVSLLPSSPNPEATAVSSNVVEYRDPAGSVWRVSEVARLNLVSPAIDGPNVFLVVRFEREGEERFVR